VEIEIPRREKTKKGLAYTPDSCKIVLRESETEDFGA
jgi:hypothetical protein